jgi:pilus assembly protein CpaF
VPGRTGASHPSSSARTADVNQQSTRHFLRPIVQLLDDPAVSEVLVNGPSDVCFGKAGRLHKWELKFPGDAFLLAAARNIAEFVNRRIDADHHSMDARLPDGSRVHAVPAAGPDVG